MLPYLPYASLFRKYVLHRNQSVAIIHIYHPFIHSLP